MIVRFLYILEQTFIIKKCLKLKTELNKSKFIEIVDSYHEINGI